MCRVQEKESPVASERLMIVGWFTHVTPPGMDTSAWTARRFLRLPGRALARAAVSAMLVVCVPPSRFAGLFVGMLRCTLRGWWLCKPQYGWLRWDIQAPTALPPGELPQVQQRFWSLLPCAMFPGSRGAWKRARSAAPGSKAAESAPLPGSLWRDPRLAGLACVPCLLPGQAEGFDSVTGFGQPGKTSAA